MTFLTRVFTAIYRFFVPEAVPPKNHPPTTGNETPEPKKKPYY